MMDGGLFSLEDIAAATIAGARTGAGKTGQKGIRSPRRACLAARLRVNDVQARRCLMPSRV
jgi:hypothetical protein